MTLGWVSRFPFATVKMLIEEDACYTMQEIEELGGIHLSSVLKILRKQLGLRKICTRWVPHLLTAEHKQSQVRLASHQPINPLRYRNI